MSKQADSVARVIGKGYAHVQHGIDRVVEWGFMRMKEQGDTQPKEAKTVTEKAASVGRGVLGFLGTLGDTYYRTYEDLKKRGK